MSAASCAGPRSPATAPPPRNGRRCSTSTPWPRREKARTGSIRACSCLPPDERRCLVSLSDGGRDANVVREFDIVDAPLRRRRLRAARGEADRRLGSTADTLLVARDWGEGTLTSSGYPFIVKRLAPRPAACRGAWKSFAARPTDVGVVPGGAARQRRHGHARWRGQFPRPSSKMRSPCSATAGRSELPLPRKSQRSRGSSTAALVADRRAVGARPGLRSPAIRWSPAISRSGSAIRSAPGRRWSGRRGERQSLSGVEHHPRPADPRPCSTMSAAGPSPAIMPDGAWRSRPLALPQNAHARRRAASDRRRRRCSTVTDFLTPSTLWLYDGATGALERIKSAPARFDASRPVVEQLEATSRTAPASPISWSGRATCGWTVRRPTLLYGYGGFQSSRRRSIRARSASCGSRPAMPMSSPTCAAAASSAPPGTRARSARTSSATWDDLSRSPRI